MFPVGMLLLLSGYSGLYVSVYRLGGDQRTIKGIIMGENGGQPIKLGKKSGASGNAVDQTITNAAKNGAAIITNPGKLQSWLDFPAINPAASLPGPVGDVPRSINKWIGSLIP